MKKVIGMVVAIEIDAVLAKYSTPAQKIEKPGYTVLHYETETCTLYVVQSGLGEIAAAAATQFLISTFAVDMILNFGVVGSLTDDIKMADVCIVKQIVHYDLETNSWQNLPRGRYPDEQDIYIPTTPALVAAAKATMPDLREVICASADKFVDVESDKRALHDAFNADICEMEAAGIVRTANKNAVPCLVIKAISDGLTDITKDFKQELNRVSEKCIHIVDKILQNID